VLLNLHSLGDIIKLKESLGVFETDIDMTKVAVGKQTFMACISNQNNLSSICQRTQQWFLPKIITTDTPTVSEIT